MKFLKINAKVLLILCLFSGILFLSTGCEDDNDSKTDKKDTTEVEKKSGENDNTTDEKKDDNNTTTNTKENENKTSSSDGTALNTTTDYSVWVANTTINTDKSQRSYKVIWGDTLWLISTAWEVPYQEIARYNHIPNPDLIYVDQIIYNPLFK